MVSMKLNSLLQENDKSFICKVRHLCNVMNYDAWFYSEAKKGVQHTHIFCDCIHKTDSHWLSSGSIEERRYYIYILVQSWALPTSTSDTGLKNRLSTLIDTA